MRIVVIGAVAAGTSAAAKARRNDEQAEIVIYEKGEHISYSGCGMPYYVGNDITNIEELAPRTPAFFQSKYNICVRTCHEVLSINREKKRILIKNLRNGEIFRDSYDKLVIATGAVPVIPDIRGIKNPHVFTLRNIQDALSIRKYLSETRPKSAVIAGSGFIGFEMLENLMKNSISVTMVETKDRICPKLDKDMSIFLENRLLEKNIRVKTSTAITEIKEEKVVLSDHSCVPAELVILATGIRPNVALVKEAGIALGETGGIKVNSYLQTNDPDIYACGDCIETFSKITGKAVYQPLGSTANKTGRIAGNSLNGEPIKYEGNLGTGIFKVFNNTIAFTGLTEEEATRLGYDVQICHNIKPDKPAYMNGKEMVIKGIADRKSGRLLGAQIIGEEGVDKRIDVFVTLISLGATVKQMFQLDLAYAPPYSTTKDPVHYTGMILENAIYHKRELITSEQLIKMRESGQGVQVIDARSHQDFESKGCVEDAKNIPHNEFRQRINELDKNSPVVTYCNKGVTGNAVQNILLNEGFHDVKNLSGGHKFYSGGKRRNKG